MSPWLGGVDVVGGDVVRPFASLERELGLGRCSCRCDGRDLAMTAMFESCAPDTELLSQVDLELGKDTLIEVKSLIARRSGQEASQLVA